MPPSNLLLKNVKSTQRQNNTVFDVANMLLNQAHILISNRHLSIKSLHLFPWDSLVNVLDVMLLQFRREVRLRREYLYRKAQEDRLRTIEEKKQKLKGALDGRMAWSWDSIFQTSFCKPSGQLCKWSYQEFWCDTSCFLYLQKIVFFQLRYAKKLCSYRNYWSMMMEGQKASVIVSCYYQQHHCISVHPFLFNHQFFHSWWFLLYRCQLTHGWWV